MTYTNDPLGDGKSRIELLSRMGSDLDVVNDARASFQKVSLELCAADKQLIKYLIKNKHTSPLRGVVFKFRVKAPLYVARQWWKHVVASSHSEEQAGWNEKSFRYTQAEDSEDFYLPQQFRQQSASNRQSSSGQLEIETNRRAVEIYKQQCSDSYKAYTDLLLLGAPREQARGALVPSVYTTWVWTASLQTVLHFLGLRLGSGAQSEIVEYARVIETLISPYVPETMRAWAEVNELQS